MGGPGQGKGGVAPERKHNTSETDTIVSSSETEGPYQFGKIRTGKGFKGETNIKFHEAATAAKKEMSQTVDNGKVPHWQRNIVKGYFDDLTLRENSKEPKPKKNK